MSIEEPKNYEDQKRQAEKMLESAFDELYRLNLHIVEGSDRNSLTGTDRERFEEWFVSFVKNVKEKFPQLEVELTQDIDDALSEARSAYNASGGASTA